MVDRAHPQAAILAAREQRAARTRQFLDRLRLPTIVLTVNAPGPDKNAPWVARVMAQGIAAIRDTLEQRGFLVCEAASYESAAGPEWRCAVSVQRSPAALKRLTVGIEESHRLGRLFDIDVFSRNLAPLGRAALGLAPRRCLVCDRAAHECVRSRRHPLSDIQAKIATLVE